MHTEFESETQLLRVIEIYRTEIRCWGEIGFRWFRISFNDELL
jgi:hypothetical protein